MRRSISVLIALVVMATMLAALATPAFATHRHDFEDCFLVDGFLFCEDADFDLFDDDFDLFDDDFDLFDRDGFGGDGDIEFNDVGASIDLSPTQTVTSDQEVNQAAVAVN